MMEVLQCDRDLLKKLLVLGYDMEKRIDAGLAYTGEVALIAAHRLAATPPADAWQPIETAPKDGSSVLLFVPMGTPTISRAMTVISHFADRICARGEDYGRTWFIHEGSELMQRPTHWRPLPAPPEVA